jgi:predicted dinucleotide-binding enzyme
MDEIMAAAGGSVSAATVREAVAGAEVVVLAVPWGVAEQAVKSAGPLSGKIVVDCTNPIAPGLQLATGPGTSAGELVAGWAPDARVVKAFNTTGANNMADPIYQGESTTMFICGDDDGAKAVVTGLAEDLGFDVADAGPLLASRFLEPLAMVWIRLAGKYGREIAFKMMQR